MKRLFLIFNHRLTPAQRSEAKKRFQVSEFILPPPRLQRLWAEIPPCGELDLHLLEQFISWLQQEAKAKDLVLIQGEYGATYYLVQRAFQIKLIPIYATSQRSITETIENNETVLSQRIFGHVQFRFYPQV